MGGLIALAINIQKGALTRLATSTYIAFFVVIAVGVFSALSILPPHLVRRKDGSVVKIRDQIPARQEIRNMFNAFRIFKIMILLPMFFASNYFCESPRI